MKAWILGAGLLLAVLPLRAQQRAVKRVIFDSDIAPDYDDVGALDLLEVFADQGKIRLLATLSNNAFATTGPCLSVINTYFGRSSVPIGVNKGPRPSLPCPQGWAEALIREFPHPLASNPESEDPVSLYRRILASEPDHSVTIVSVGFFTNLAGLLRSRPDRWSSLDGRGLVLKKVRRLVAMATGWPMHHEFNVYNDIPASKEVIMHWPGPLTLSGFEIGEHVYTGLPLLKASGLENSPVRRAFQIALTKDGQLRQGHPSWDETAAWVAVMGRKPYFRSRQLNWRIDHLGNNLPAPGTRIRYLELAVPPDSLARAINAVLVQPARHPYLDEKRQAS